MIIIMMINWFGNGWDCKMKFVYIYIIKTWNKTMWNSN